MIKEKELNKIENMRRLNKQWAVDDAINFISEIASENSIDICADREQVKFGGLFNSSVLDAILITNNEHKKDYARIVVVFNENFSRAETYQYGTSKLIKKHEVKTFGEDLRRQNMRDRSQKISERIAFNVGNKLATSVLSMGYNSKKHEAELEYYEILFSIIREL